MVYDVAIIGAGVSGVFTAYSLAKAGKRVILIDKGHDLAERQALLPDNPQIQYEGFGGLGMSEGKYNYTNDFGGGLSHKIGSKPATLLMQEVDQILCQFGAQGATFYTTDDPALMAKCQQAGLTMLTAQVRHLGTVKSQQVLRQIRHFLDDKISFAFNTTVQSLAKQGESFQLSLSDGRRVNAKNVVIATGNAPSEWLEQQMRRFDIKEGQARVDLGLRVEMPYSQWQPLLQRAFETKLKLETADFTATTYCMNPTGRIIRKYEKGLVMADGQNCNESDVQSENLNFTLFVPQYFPTQADAKAYAEHIIKAINRGGERIVVQRLGCLNQGKPTTQQCLIANGVKPSLAADGGYLPDEVPEIYLAAAGEFFQRLSQLLEQPISADTLLYGLDAKFFAPQKVTSEFFETTTGGLYLAGDCSGVTHSLSQAAASGLHIAKRFCG
ncbi:FAD-dependent oxidoreductase [Budvicia diplopodorum]|uniref:FAD-dependent oxidoreductase n=1 Tax=Budvicia diplopodorum TaxID=1119056 RepID=UPI00135674D7|nr:FAD-dependent oxidoreductase [Budvicia diplopodorum]